MTTETCVYTDHGSSSGCGMFDIGAAVGATHERHYSPDRDGTIVAAWTHGYPVTYYGEDGTIVCGDHAWSLIVREDIELIGDIFYEGPAEWCDEGSHLIFSAYGDPDCESHYDGQDDPCDVCGAS